MRSSIVRHHAGGAPGVAPRRLRPAAVLALASLTIAGCNRAERDRAAADSAGTAADSAATASAGGRVYVSNEDSNDISVIDAGTDSVVATIFVGKRPRGIRVGPDGRHLFVAVSGSPKAPPGVDESTLPPPDKAADGIAVVDLATHKLLRVLPGGSDPESFAISRDGKQLYVSNEDAGTASVLDVESGKIERTVPVGGEPEGVEMTPDGRFVYVTSEEHHQVAVLSTDSAAVVATVEVGLRPRSVAFTPDGARGFVSNELGGSLTAVDAKAHRPTGTIKIPGEGAKPMGLAMSRDGGRLFVSTGRGGAVAVVDVAGDSVLRTVEVGARPWGIGLSRDGRKLYTANGPSGDVSVVDVASMQVVKRIKVGRSPWGIAIAN